MLTPGRHGLLLGFMLLHYGAFVTKEHAGVALNPVSPHKQNPDERQLLRVVVARLGGLSNGYKSHRVNNQRQLGCGSEISFFLRVAFKPSITGI